MPGVGDDEDDLIQDIFIKAYVNIQSFDTGLKFSSWIYRIAHNEAVSWIRKKKVRPETVELGEGDFEEMIERHSAIEDAINNGDYEEWSNLMDGRGRISDVVTEDNFDTFVAMHEAVEEGDYEKAQELREDLGLGIRSGDGNGFRKGGHGRGMMRGGFNL
jgi:RNA polymerase sigma factor (sigma-70 family)